MADFESKGSAYRIKKCAFDFQSIGNDLVGDDDDDESWDLMARDLRLRSTFLFCDFSRVIACAPKDRKKALTELANRLFCSIEELDHAVKNRDVPLIQNRFSEALVVLQEVTASMP